MSKIVLFQSTLSINEMFDRYIEGDEYITGVIVCKDLPEAKQKAKQLLQDMMDEVDKLKLKDIPK